MKNVKRICITEPDVVGLVNDEMKRVKAKTATRVVSNIVREHFISRRLTGGDAKPRRRREPATS